MSQTIDFISTLVKVYETPNKLQLSKNSPIIPSKADSNSGLPNLKDLPRGS